MSIIFVPIYIKYIGIEGFGLVSIFVALSAIFGLLEMGMAPALNREVSNFLGGARSEQYLRNLLRTIEIIFFGVGTFVVLMFYFGSEFIIDSLLKLERSTNNGVNTGFYLMGAIAACRLFENIYSNFIAGFQRQVHLNIINSCIATVKGLGVILVLDWISPTTNTFFAYQLFISILSIVILRFLTYQSFPNSNLTGIFDINSLKSIRRLSASILLILILAQLITHIDKWFIVSSFGLKSFGYYGLATTVAGITYYFSNSIIQAIYPRLCELHGNKKDNEFIEIYHVGTQMVTIFSGGFSIFLFFFADEILFFWTNDRDLVSNVALPLRVLCLCALLNTQIQIPFQAQLAYGWTLLALVIHLLAIIFYFPLLMIMTPRYGLVGVAVSLLIINFGFLIFWPFFMHKKILIQEKLRWYLNDMVIPIFSMLFLGCILKLFSFDTDNRLLQFIYLGVLFVSFILVGIFSCRDFRAFMFNNFIGARVNDGGK
jgi:O-antigen/teichoic acid export membrane protein